MKDTTPTCTVNRPECTGCGLCVQVCPTNSLVMNQAAEESDAAANLSSKFVEFLPDSGCFGCCHCEAICPHGAIANSNKDDVAQQFSTFDFDATWLAPKDCDLPSLVRLMASRRSCRSYTSESVGKDVLEDIVKAGIAAPSGTNSQKWTFTCVQTREGMLSLAEKVLRFFQRLNAVSSWWIIRNGLRVFGVKSLHDYYHRYYKTIEGGIRLWKEEGVDLLWHGAPSAIIISSRPGASCPAEDCLLAAQNMGLAAHAMGLGSLLVGFAVNAMVRDASIQESVGIPRDETVYAVLALGHTKERYTMVAGRKMPVIRWV